MNAKRAKEIIAEHLSGHPPSQGDLVRAEAVLNKEVSAISSLQRAREIVRLGGDRAPFERSPQRLYDIAHELWDDEAGYAESQIDMLVAEARGFISGYEYYEESANKTYARKELSERLHNRNENRERGGTKE